MSPVGGKPDFVAEWLRQQTLTILVLQLDRELDEVRAPGNRNAKAQTDGETGMSGREAAYPEGVPASAENEQFAADRLNRVCQERDVDRRPQTLGR